MNVVKTQEKRSVPKIPEEKTDNSLNQSILSLEGMCARLLEARFAVKDDSERMYWQQRFKNIVTPVSLALVELKGPRRFHHHYRHDANNEDVLLPVLENPLDMLANTCKHALQESAIKLSGIHDSDLLSAQRKLERALNEFLAKYKLSKA